MFRKFRKVLDKLINNYQTDYPTSPVRRHNLSRLMRLTSFEI